MYIDVFISRSLSLSLSLSLELSLSRALSSSRALELSLSLSRFLSLELSLSRPDAISIVCCPNHVIRQEHRSKVNINQTSTPQKDPHNPRIRLQLPQKELSTFSRLTFVGSSVVRAFIPCSCTGYGWVHP